MQKNDTNPKVVKVILAFVGIMFFIPVIMVISFEGFSIFAMIPLFMFSSFGLFMFLMIKFAAKTNKNLGSNSYQTSGDRHCTSCHEAIDVNSQYCPYCGTPQTDFVICDYCGTKNSKHDLMCTNCNGLLK